MKHIMADKHKRTFRVYSQEGPASVNRINKIVGKFRDRTYRIDKKKIDKKSGCYTFLLANPNLALRTNNHPGKIINEIRLCFHPEEEGYSVDAACYSVYIEDDKIIPGRSVAQTSLVEDEIKFGKAGVRKTLIEILEDP